MAQVLLGGFSWKFRAITSLTDELNSSCSISQGGKVKGAWLLCEVVLLLLLLLGFVVGFWFGFFLKILSSFSFHSSRLRDGLQRSSHSLDVTVFWGVALSNGVR